MSNQFSLTKRHQGTTNLKLGQSFIKYSTFKLEDNITQEMLVHAMETFKFNDGYRYWISCFYPWGRRGGESFDGNNFTADNLYNLSREYKGSSNGIKEIVKYITIYTAKLPNTLGGDDDEHNDCFYYALKESAGKNKLPKKINTPKKLKSYLQLERDENINFDHIAQLEKEIFPDNTSINVKGIIPYVSKKVHTTLNFNLKLTNGHYISMCNEGKSKHNLNTKLYEFNVERTAQQVLACYIDGDKVHIYNGEYSEISFGIQ